MQTPGQIKTWLATATTRKTGLTFTAASIQEDANGNPNTIVGTIGLPATAAVAATGTTPAIPAVAAATIDMMWNINGQAMNQNRAYDLVKVINLSDIVAA